ncbi:hypothetical protein [Roseateles sp.]
MPNESIHDWARAAVKTMLLRCVLAAAEEIRLLARGFGKRK